jgi:hypothetical protein
MQYPLQFFCHITNERMYEEEDILGFTHYFAFILFLLMVTLSTQEVNMFRSMY